jgi:hypothetical protein
MTRREEFVLEKNPHYIRENAVILISLTAIDRYNQEVRAYVQKCNQL